ncbi:Protein arginine N-methyltransferase 3 [Chytridiales sp. JEL 0842]|nr:Protein arginine N-methyltransferase 3 [Chytridiales sp. JEL 0842]
MSVRPPPSEVDIDEQEDNTWSDFGDDEDCEALCLVCDHQAEINEVVKHMISEHALDLKAIKKDLGLDFYGCMRLINYMRTLASEKHTITAENLKSETAWVTDDKFLQPVLENDAFLYAFEFDDEEESTTQDLHDRMQQLDIKSQGEAAMAERILYLESKLATAQRSFEEYQNLVRKTFLEDAAGIEFDDASLRSVQIAQKPAGAPEDEMDYYFQSYTGMDIHEIMLKDAVRTDSYRDAVYLNKDAFAGKIVLDVGCGTGILSMFAARAGAAKVYAVDRSGMIQYAKAIAAENGLQDKIEFIHGEVEKITLPVEKVDIIISEWMGYFLLFEGMLDSVLVARDRWLAKDGTMVPSGSRIFLTAMDDEEWYNERCLYWENVYGFTMSPLRKSFVAESQVDFVSRTSFISNSALLTDIDISKVTVPELDYTTPFSLKINKKGRVHGLCGWFDIQFEFENGTKVDFSTSAEVKGTHWKQTVFVLEEVLDVVEGDVIEGIFVCKKARENSRELSVEIEYEHKCAAGGGSSKKKQNFYVR